MKRLLTFSLCALLISFFSTAQDLDQFQEKALNRQFINRNDTVYRFYAISPIAPVAVRPDRSYYWYKSDTILITKGGYDGKLLDGAFTSFYPDKNLQEEGAFKNGLRQGVWKRWYPGGRLQSIIHWKNGFREGDFTEYDSSGGKRREGEYKHDLLSGTLVEYEGQHPPHRTVYKNGQPVIHGRKRKYADTDDEE